MVLETTGSLCHVVTTSMYFPVHDSFFSEMSKRFDDKKIDIMRAVQACNPLSKTLPALLPLVEAYEDTIDMETKLAHWKRKISTALVMCFWPSSHLQMPSQTYFNLSGSH